MSIKRMSLKPGKLSIRNPFTRSDSASRGDGNIPELPFPISSIPFRETRNPMILTSRFRARPFSRG